MNTLPNHKKAPLDEGTIEGIEKLAFYNQETHKVEVIDFEEAKKGVLINFKDRPSYNIRVNGVYFTISKPGEPFTRVAMDYLKEDRPCYSGELEGIIIGKNKDIFYVSNVYNIQLKSANS